MFSDLLNESGLSLDRLESFCLVAQAGGVTKAAKGDPAKQSLFSRQIKELEAFFGTELIRRKGRGIVLTEAGARLNGIARDCFASLSDFKGDCKGRPVEIVIGTGESIIQWLLMPRLDELRAAIPNVLFKFLNLPTSEAVSQLANGMIDFAIVRSDAVGPPLVTRPLGKLAYALFLPASHPVASMVNAKALNALPLVTLEGGGSFRTQLDEIGRQNGIRFRIEIQCPSFPLAARAVARGKVAAILPKIAGEDLRAAGVHQVGLPFLKLLDREVCIAYNARLVRIRPSLERVATALTKVCRL